MDSVSSPIRPRSVRSLAAGVFLALGVGVLTGLATLVGQGILPGQWNTLVNSGAIWLVAVFLVGSRMPSRASALAAGTGTLLSTVAAYYGSAALTGAPISLRNVMFWAVVALVAGPLFGLAGYWRYDERRMLRVAGVALLGGVLVAEGLYLLLVPHARRLASSCYGRRRSVCSDLLAHQLMLGARRCPARLLWAGEPNKRIDTDKPAV